MVSEELGKMGRKELEAAKAALSLLRLLGMREEEIDALPETLRDAKEMGREIEAIRQEILSLRKALSDAERERKEPKDRNAVDSYENIRSAAMLGEEGTGLIDVRGLRGGKDGR